MKKQKVNQPQQAQIELPQIDYYLKEKELINKIRLSASIRKIPIIDEITGDFISVLCLSFKPKHILEIGCGTGYSTYFLLKNLNHDFSYTGIDLNRERISEAKKFIDDVFGSRSVGKKIHCGNLNFMHGNAIKIIPDLKEGFDLVFIDAAKSEYPDYIKSVRGKLNRGAIVIADNIFYKNKLFNENISKHDHNSIMGIRGYLEFISRTDLFENHFFSIGDGMVLSKYKYIQ